MRIINNVSFYRNSLNLSRSELADLCGVSYNTIKAIESFNTIPKFDLCIALSVWLHQPVHKLFQAHSLELAQEVFCNINAFPDSVNKVYGYIGISSESERDFADNIVDDCYNNCF